MDANEVGKVRLTDALLGRILHDGLMHGWERVHLRNTHTRLRSANEGNTDMGVP